MLKILLIDLIFTVWIEKINMMIKNFNYHQEHLKETIKPLTSQIIWKVPNLEKCISYKKKKIILVQVQVLV
jgi:hypothetical protein